MLKHIKLLVLSTALAVSPCAQAQEGGTNVEQMEQQLQQLLQQMFQVGNEASKQAYGIDLTKEFNVDEKGNPLPGQKAAAQAPSQDPAAKPSQPESEPKSDSKDDYEQSMDQMENMLNTMFSQSIGMAAAGTKVLGKMAESDLRRLKEERAGGSGAVASGSEGTAAARSHVGKGTLLAMFGDIDPAIEEFKLALQADPEFPTAYYNLACAYGLKGQAQPAAKALSKAAALDPKYISMARRDSDFDAVRSSAEIKAVIGAADSEAQN